MPSIIMEDLVELMKECIMENCRFTIMELSRRFSQISCSFLHKVVTEHLLFRKLCTRWVPKQLTPELKAKRTKSALTFLQWYHDEGDKVLDLISIGNEIWFAHITPRKQATVNALASQWISLQDEIHADVVDVESDVHCVLGQMGHSPHQLSDQRSDGEC